MVWHAERGLRELEGGDGPVLGLERLDPPHETAHATIAPDELVVLVSDGVLERTAPGGLPSARPGCDRASTRWTRRAATAATAAILEGVAMTHDGPLRDDASVVVLGPL
jgi:serine phosphatase RsbU (regulator of sigma subunit)